MMIKAGRGDARAAGDRWTGTSGNGAGQEGEREGKASEEVSGVTAEHHDAVCSQSSQWGGHQQMDVVRVNSPRMLRWLGGEVKLGTGLREGSELEAHSGERRTKESR
jgi:hypothetical protein